MSQPQAFPLAWPVGYPRTESYKRKRSDFKPRNFGAARDDLMAEIRRLSGRNAILSTNIPLRQDGLPYANMGRIQDPGVAVYFQRNGKSLVLACDRWDRIEDNLRAIELTIDAMRGMERWGCSDMLNRAFTGFTALPPPLAPQPKRAWWEVLGVSQLTPTAMVEAQYKILAKLAHTDQGGSHEKMVELNAAISEFRESDRRGRR